MLKVANANQFKHRDGVSNLITTRTLFINSSRLTELVHNNTLPFAFKKNSTQRLRKPNQMNKKTRVNPKFPYGVNLGINTISKGTKNTLRSKV